MKHLYNSPSWNHSLFIALAAGALFVAGCGDDDAASTTDDTTRGEDASANDDETSHETDDNTNDETSLPPTNDSSQSADAAASNEDTNTADAGIGGNAADGGAPSNEADAASTSDEAAIDAGPAVEPETSFIVGGYIETNEAWYGVLGVVDDLSSNNSFDLGKAVSFDGDFTFTGYQGAVYVGHQENPIIEKWVVNGKGQLELADDLSFMAYGVEETHGASHNVIQVIDDETAWFFDHANGRVLVFNPTTMTTAGETIDYYAIYDGLDLAAGDWPDIGEVGRVGDYIAVPMFWYAISDDTIPLDTRIALINTKTNDVTIAKDTRCAGSNVMSTDSDGNLYFGPHAAAALWSAEGSAGEAVPCIIRILNGETEVDQNYLVNLNDLTGGKAVVGPFQGRGDKAYVLQFDGELGAGARSRMLDAWNLYSLDLGIAEPAYTHVEGWPQGNSNAVAFSLRVGTETKYYLASVAQAGKSSAYYEIRPDGSVQKGLNFAIQPAHAVNY